MKGFGFFVLVKKIKDEAVKSAGIEIDNEDVRFGSGEVITFGEKVEGLEVGDIVKYDKNLKSGIEIDGDNLSYSMIKVTDIALVL